MLVRIKCLKQVPLWILSWLRDYGVSLSSKNPSYGEFNYIPKAGIILARVHDVKLLKATVSVTFFDLLFLVK